MSKSSASFVIDRIENKSLDLNQTNYYVAILGESPSKGAKSPTLWNAVFKTYGILAMMHPMDVKAENLAKLVESLREDDRYIGGAVTMPYKVQILPHLDEVEAEAKTIGAVNCVFRKGKKLIGTNTDGAGALGTLKDTYGSVEGRTVLLLGTGGAGSAVAAYIASALGKKGTIRIANRSNRSIDQIAENLKQFCNVETIKNWPVQTTDAKGVDIIVNCTSIGFETIKKDGKGAYSLKDYSPLGEVKNEIRVADSVDAEKQYRQLAKAQIEANQKYSAEILKAAGQPFVFDIVYQPKETTLLRQAKEQGSRILNGLPMNLEQAVIAFVKTNKASNLFNGSQEQVRAIMEKNR